MTVDNNVRRNWHNNLLENKNLILTVKNDRIIIHISLSCLISEGATDPPIIMTRLCSRR